MFKKILQSTVISLLSLAFLVPIAHGSAKMEAALGEEVTLQAEGVLGFINRVKWTVVKDGEIFNVQNSPTFRYIFLEQGEYEVIAEVSDNQNQPQTTSVFVLAGKRFSMEGSSQDSLEGGLSGGSGGPITLVYQTLPRQDPAGNVTLLGDGRLAIDIQAIDPRVLEYRVDYNIYQDSDGDGIANNDIDNANERCFLLGGICQTTYTLGEVEKVTVQITLVSRSGEKVQQQFNVLFDAPAQNTGDLMARLDVLPIPESNTGMVNLYKPTHQVGFYARNSGGDIKEYRIDKNIFVDSDGDGNPSNDIDNLNHDSFRTGDVWVTEYEKSDEQIIASLTIVGEGGKGSRVERGVVFTEPPVIAKGQDSSDTSILLKADKPFVLGGDPVNFSVENLSRPVEDYTFEWDFDGDETIDKVVEGDNSVSYIYENAGIFPVMVKVTDSDGNTGNFKLDFLVEEPRVTKADFEFTVEGNTVSFLNLSTASIQLGNKDLNYTWSFGETDEVSYEAQKEQTTLQNPVYTYAEPGIYQVTLTVVDANRIKDTYTQEIVVEEGVLEDPSAQDNENGEKVSGSWVITILKILAYILLVILILVILFLAGLMIFIKVQHPDDSFGEIVDGVKLKLLSLLGVGEMVEADSSGGSPANAGEVEQDLFKEKSPPIIDVEQGEEPAPSEPQPGPIHLDEKPIKISDDAQGIEASHPGTGPMPDWLKPQIQESAPDNEDVIDGEVEEENDDEEEEGDEDESQSDEDSASDSKVGEEKLNSQDGPVPDWLKDK